MRALVVFESMFGNTEAIARAVAVGLPSYLQVDVVDVGHAPASIGADVVLLAVGGPTHAFGLSRPGTRRSAVDQGADPAAAHAVGLREWLGDVIAAREGVRALAFDTRVAGASGRPKVPGSAARKAGKRLRGLGFDLIAAPESFFVSDTGGPLLPGEAERAHQWAVTIGAQLPLGDNSVS